MVVESEHVDPTLVLPVVAQGTTNSNGTSWIVAASFAPGPLLRSVMRSVMRA